MGVLDRIGILIKAKIKARMDAEDPEKILDRSINDMQAILAGYHQKLVQSIAALNLREQQSNQSATQAQEWEKRAILDLLGNKLKKTLQHRLGKGFKDF